MIKIDWSLYYDIVIAAKIGYVLNYTWVHNIKWLRKYRILGFEYQHVIGSMEHQRFSTWVQTIQ